MLPDLQRCGERASSSNESVGYRSLARGIANLPRPASQSQEHDLEESLKMSRDLTSARSSNQEKPSNWEGDGERARRSLLRSQQHQHLNWRYPKRCAVKSHSFNAVQIPPNQTAYLIYRLYSVLDWLSIRVCGPTTRNVRILLKDMVTTPVSKWSHAYLGSARSSRG